MTAGRLGDPDRAPDVLAAALFDLLRSQAPTNPPLQKGIHDLGQVASDLLARSGYQGKVCHHVLRVLALIPRKLLWKHVNQTGNESGWMERKALAFFPRSLR